MYEQSGRYDQPLEATFKPPRGGLADKYRATRAPPRKNDTVADSDVSFGWIDDIDSGKSRKEDPPRSQTDLGKSRHGELSSWNGLEASSRGRGYDFEGSSLYNNNVVRTKPPSGNTRGHAGMIRKPPTGPQRAQGDRFSESSRLTKEEPAQDRYSNPGNSWRTMALSNPGEDGMGWGTMFGRMQIRWSGREQRKQAMALATLARQKDTDGRGLNGSNMSDNSKSGSLRPYRQRRKRFYTFILASVLLLVLAVAIVIPTVVFTRTDDKSGDEVLDSYVIYNFQAESPDLVFQAEMNNSTSEIYINTAQEFCTGMESKMASNYSEQYAGCVVTGLQNGSVIFIFSLIFDESPASPTTTQINLVIVGTSNPNETFQLGSFTITTESLNLTSTSVSTTADFTDVNCLAPTPVENGNWSYSSSRFSDIAVLTCNTGYEIQGDANITCTEQYQWSSRPNCTEVVCVNYTLPADSSIEPLTPYGITYNTNITVTCNPGFDITGDSIVSCMADGNWSTSPRCNIKSCPNFTKPDYSQLTPTTPSKVYNSFFIVTCDEGYVISGENNVTCLANGTWSARPSCNAIVCRNYTIPDNSSTEPLIISGHRYKTNITVTCNQGYGIDGEEIVMCMADGNWSGSPTCNIKSCPNYTIPENSRISPATPEITYGSGYIVMCDEGYESDGDTNVTCGADATWSTIPECKIIECPVFSNITDGYINTDNISYPRFNSTVNVTCDVGYSLSSNDTVRCRSNKTWSVIPSCDNVTCEEFIPPANSKLDDGKIPTNRTYNTVISVSCNTGYNITGDAEVTCMANGNWSATPRCDKIVCVEYIVPDNANIEPNTTSNQTFNTTLKVSCYVGYEIIGDSDVICEADGSWSKNPSCEIVVCYEFLTPENGMINPQNTTGLVFNSTIEVSCIDGYKLSEEDTVRCTASRNWSSLPRCEPIDCDAFIFPENSIHQNSSITSEGSIKYREELSVECVDGYVLVGQKTFSCNASGQWPKITCNKVECNKTEIDKPFLFIVVEENDVYDMACDEGYNLKGNATVMCDQGNWTDIPDCEIVPCGPIVLNGNGTINANDTNYGDFAVLICDPGFEGDDQFVCQADGNWSGNPTCTPVICPPYNLPNGTVSSTVNEPYSFADVVMLSCQDGFDVVGGTMITCSEDKNWSDNTTCRAIECAETLSIENGNVIPNRTKILTFSESVMVECNVGFELNGSKEIVCQSSGKLSEKPKCDKVQCRNFRFPENSIEYMLNASFYGSNITLTCMDGYIVNGPPVSTCQANKTWTEIGECEPIPCDTVTLPEDMQTADSNKTISGKMFGEKVNIICVNNKLLTGEEQISCTKFGNWSINSKCVETDCDINTFNQPDHSKIIEANNTHLHLECNEGYKIVGEEIVICDNSRWSASPNCTIVSCGELEDPINGNINSTGVTYLENATLECIQGFTPKNSKTFSCLATGNWSDIAECESVDCGNPDPPANAENISVADTKYGTREAYITCKEGFETESPVNVTCSETGDWASVPSCDIVVCLENPTIENGKIEVAQISDREYGDTLFIKCDEGYEVETNSSVKCEANGSWSGLKNCSMVDCGVFNETLANGTVVNMTGSTFNERVDFECDPGFLLVGENYITCQQNRSWGNPPVCEEIMCIDPNITYGTYRKYSGSVYEVECDDGFLLTGSNFIECQTNQSWDQRPTCREIICMNYTEELLNGDIVEITGTRYGDTVTFVCDLGFNLNGPQSIVCDENGAWESKPICEITDCGDPPVLVNGRLLAGESTTFNTTLYAECDIGYSLDGTDETTCGESGNWSVLGVCELQDCGNVTVFGPYKELTYSNGTRYGSVVTIECAENYTLRSEDSAVCTQDWNVTFICSSIGNVSFDMAQYEFTVGDPGIIICSAEGAENWTNLFLSKSNSILVNINRTENTYINKTESARIRITDNTVISKNSATLEVEILSVACTDEDTYDCAIGVTLPSGDIDFNLGQATVEVIDTGTEVPTLRVSNTTYNTTAVVTCESLLGINATGHPLGSLLLQARLKSDTDFNTLIPELENTTSEECNKKGFLQYSFLVNGSWDDAEVKCVIDTDNGTLESETIIIAITGVVCDGLPTVVFGSVINASTEDDQIFTVVCDEGHENVGDMNFTCTTLGWTGDPNCALLDCGQPVEFNNTVIEFTNETTTYNSIVFGFCKDDYNVEQIFDDKTYIVCGADGNWNISFTCKPVQCENVTAPLAGRIVSSNETTVNSVLEIECDEGFNLVGNYSMAVCSSDGFWVRPGADNDSFIPRCTAIGELTFDFESNVTAVESNLTATCSLLKTPDWNRIGVFRQPEGEDISFVAVVNKSSDNSTANETVLGVEILSSSYFRHEEAVLKIQITNVTCDNDGEYLCGALKGNISVIADDNSLAIESYVTVTSEPDVPMLNISQTSLEPDEEIEFSCQGYVGQTSTRDNKAQLDLQIRYSDKSDFEIITKDIAPVVKKTGCLIQHTKRINFTVNSTYDGAVLRCVTDDGSSPLLSSNVTLTVAVVCDVLPSVDFGSVTNGTSEAGQILAVVCNEGFINLGDTNFTCTASGWSGNPNCTLIDCGPPIDFNYTVFDLTNETTTYNSTVSGLCQDGHNVEQIHDNTPYIVCGADGNWNISFMCKPVECNNITELIAGSIVFSNGTTFKSVIEIACDEGYTLVGNHSTAVCNASGVWVRLGTENEESFLPTCTDLGELTFDFESNVTAVQSNLTATCTLLNTPDWNRIGIFRPTEGEDNDFVAFVDKLSDNSTDKETVPGVEILSGSYFYHDKAVLEIQITNVTCENDGVYVCGAVKGNVSEITKNNSLTVETLITITSESEVPMLNVSKTSLEPDEEVELSCQGYVGQTSTRGSKAKIDLQIKYSGNTDFETITSSITPEVTQVGCAIEHIKRTTITVNSAYDGALLRCISDDGASVLFSDNFTLTVTDLSGVTFELRAVAEDAEFIAEMNDPLSSVFIDFQSDFCNGYATRVGQSDLSEQYLDCRVVSLGEGSIIIHFEIKFQGDSPPSASRVISTLTETANDTDTVQIGAYSITKSLVEVIVVTATKGSVSVLFTTDKSVFSIGEASALNINIQGNTAWEIVSISKTRDGVQTSIGNITESFANVQFFSDHLSLSSDSTSNETDANIIIDFEAVKCDDDGKYTVEVRMDDGQSVQVDKEITLEYTPRVDLTLPVEMREDRWTLNITCEAVFHSSVNRTLSWLRKGGGDTEFVEFSPEDIVEKPVEFRHNISLHTNYECLWRVKEDFDLNTTSADTWNNTQFRCALDYGTPEQVLSEVGTILLVPRNVCAGIEAGEHVQNPLECTKRVRCNAMSGDWGYVFATGCEEGTCWVGPGDSDCENISITTTTTTTTPVPGTPYIFCSDTMRSEKEGTIAFFPCELRNIDKIGTLNISLDDDPIYSDSDETNGISGVLSIGDNITVIIDKDSLNVSIETSCKNEGLYQIEINNGTDAELSLALIADPETPEISLPSNIYQNQRTDLTCTGIVGRDKDGNNSADLSFEIRKADSDMFQVVDGAISRVNEENNCTITQKASLSAYFEKDFNKSAIRCVAKADAVVLSESALYNISLVDPSVSFVEANVSSFIGEPFSLECNVENVANLTKLELTKDGTTLAFRSLDGESSEADVKIVVARIEDGSGRLKVNFSISKCSDKGEYICEAITTAGVSHSTKASVSIQRKPELPQLYPSLQIIEGVSPWAIFPTQCYGEVGYPQGTVSLESNRDGNEFVSIDDAEAVYTVDDEKCSSIGNITYYNTYTLDWDNTELRCVTRNSLVGDDADFVTSVTKTINVIPASFCDGKEDDPVLHPYYCYGRLTCDENGRPIPYHLCNGNNTQCYDESQGTCVDCESVDKCDVGSTPAPTLPPGTPIMNCTNEVKGTKNSIVTINCELTNINVTLATLNSSNVFLTRNTDGSVVLDTATASNFSTSESEYVYTEGPVTASIASSMIQIQMNLTECDIAGDYTVRYNGNSLVEDTINFVITADAVPPVLSQRPNVFYADQSATIQCTGNVGSPAGNLSLIYKTNETGEWLDVEVGTTEETEDEETCGIIVTKIRELDVTEDLDGYIYACETVTRDNQTYRSGQIQVSVQDPVLLFREAEITAAIGNPLALACTWNTTIINASATISRSAIGFGSEEILLIYEFGENVTSQKSGVNGNFQIGDEGRPNNLSLTFDEISCEDEAIYSCKLLVDDELVAEAKETIYVTSNHSTPTMTLPKQLVLDQPTLYDDFLKCNGSFGYPSDNSVLKLEYYSEDGQNVNEFDMGTLVENRTETDDCMTEGELSYRTITFDSSWNGTIFRCALYDGDGILDTSDNKTLLLFENNCDAENDEQYFQHPYDCHLHIRCHNNGTISVGSCATNCPNFLSNNTLVTCNNACDDLNCPST